MRSKSLVVAGSVVAVALAGIGALHAPFARPLLMRLGGCPMAGARMTAAESERARHMGLASPSPNALPVPAPVRPALGFTLDSTTLTDVHAWAKRERVDCDDARPGFVKCTDVRPAALALPAADGNVDELTMAFDVQGRLVNMATFRTHLDPAAAAISARTIVSLLEARLGPAETRAGTFDASHLQTKGAGSIATVSYRFSDYVADVTAINAPSGGPSIREHYMSARD